MGWSKGTCLSVKHLPDTENSVKMVTWQRNYSDSRETEGRKKVLKALNTLWFFLSQMRPLGWTSPKVLQEGDPREKKNGSLLIRWTEAGILIHLNFLWRLLLWPYIATGNELAFPAKQSRKPHKISKAITFRDWTTGSTGLWFPWLGKQMRQASAFCLERRSGEQCRSGDWAVV